MTPFESVEIPKTKSLAEKHQHFEEEAESGVIGDNVRSSAADFHLMQ